jgi:hypothetical protein
MGAPVSAVLADPQHLEHNQVHTILIKHQIIAHDIVIIYNNKTHIDTIMMEFNAIHPAINFTTENESDKKLNFLDMTIHRKNKKINFTINRKPTSTDILIHNSSCHPNEHKVASMNKLTNRLHTYPISKHATDTELGVIKTSSKTTKANIHIFTQNSNKASKTRTRSLMKENNICRK